MDSVSLQPSRYLALNSCKAKYFSNSKAGSAEGTKEDILIVICQLLSSQQEHSSDERRRRKNSERIALKALPCVLC